jgi:DICT domain-containing protein
MPKFRTTAPSTSLSVGELARLTGVAAATLRSWEARHDFPKPARQSGGHRRYDERDSRLVAEVVRLRRAGLSVEAAIEAARRGETGSAGSFFAALQSGYPDLRPVVLSKRILSALTSAVEDECCARARRPVLFGAFQRAAFYRQSERRWQELARTAEHSVVFADFDALRKPKGRPIESPLAEDAPARREWALICDAPGYSACVAGWELPGPSGTPDHERRFETVWTLDPGAVRSASHVGVSLLARSYPAVARDLSAGLPEVTASASADLGQATGLLARALSYADVRLPPLSGPR